MSYQEFMLGGFKGVVPSTPSPSSSLQTQDSSPKKKRKKPFGPIFRAFQGRLEEWKDLDGQLKAVLGSIANLRDRICWESRQLILPTSTTAREWEGCGFRARSNLLLTGEDVDMALTHDLLQHEKMMAGARTLISSMSLAQEAMARRLDEWLTYQLEEEEEPGGEGRSLLDQVQDTYLLIAGELYRKQMLVQKILDSCHDGLVDKQASQMLQEDGSPRSVARKCCKNWSSRGELKEQWLVVDELLKIHSINY
jgi:hypothetical protein